MAGGVSIVCGVASVGRAILNSQVEDSKAKSEGGMPSILNEAIEWLDRVEQAREVAGQLTGPTAKTRYWSLPTISTGWRELPSRPHGASEKEGKRKREEELMISRNRCPPVR